VSLTVGKLNLLRVFMIGILQIIIMFFCPSKLSKTQLCGLNDSADLIEKALEEVWKLFPQAVS